MISNSGFGGLWHRNDNDFDLPAQPGQEQPNLCDYALKFSQWAEELCAGATQHPTIVGINQAKIQLIDKYFEWRTFAPKRHRSYMFTGANSHVCLWHVFEAAYDRLKLLELSLTPPMLFVPAPPPPLPPPPPPPQIAGIFIGELDEG